MTFVSALDVSPQRGLSWCPLLFFFCWLSFQADKEALKPPWHSSVGLMVQCSASTEVGLLRQEVLAPLGKVSVSLFELLLQPLAFYFLSSLI